MQWHIQKQYRYSARIVKRSVSFEKLTTAIGITVLVTAKELVSTATISGIFAQIARALLQQTGMGRRAILTCLKHLPTITTNN